MEWDGVQFVCDPDCREYDWLVVYDELPRRHKVEELACPAAHTRIYERHYLRRNPLHLLSEGLELARARWLMGR